MKLKVSLRQQRHHEASDVQITADGRATVGDVAAALAHSDQLAGQWPQGRPVTLRLRGGQQDVAVAPERTLLESGIRSGSMIEIAFAEDAAREAQQRRAVAVVRIVTGPDAGREFPLAEVVATVGRSAGNDVQLTDPLVSKSHARLTIGARIEIADDNSANGVWVGGRRISSKTFLGPGDVAEVGNTKLQVVAAVADGYDGMSTEIAFIRSPRVLARPVDTRIELPDPPRQSPGVRFPWLSLIAPLVMGAVLYLTTRSALSLVFVGLSPVLMLGNYLDQRTQRRRAFRDEVRAFESGLRAADARLTQEQTQERAELLALHPSVAECAEAIRGHTPLLWSRRPEHPEFLQIRVGLGGIAPLHHAVLPRVGGLTAFQDRAIAVADDHAVLETAPVVVDVRSVGGLGVCGTRSHVESVARGLLTQLVTLHSPSEVTVACLTSDEGRHRWGWLEWVPHTSSPHSPLPGFHLSADPETGRLLLSKLEELVMLRTGGRVAAFRGPLGKDENADPPTVPSVVVVVDEATVDLARLSRIAEHGPDVGVFLVWVAPDVAALPAACRTFVEIDDNGAASVGMVRRGRTVASVECETLSREAATELARRLAPVVDAGAPVDDQSDLPRSVSVVSLLTAEASDDPAVVLSRWRENQSVVDRVADRPQRRDRPLGLHAVVGHDGTGRLTLDLRSQGPHALVGGTTNSGKSEFLQAWVLGMAHAYSPDRVTFLFVDYKGGSAFADFEYLPHNVGMVTDLSPYLVRRALDSLRAELTRREHLLNNKGKKDLIELEMTGDPECPPSLIIVVDEFAALAKEMPEFVDGMVDIAARGRSLGLHLILATQRPAGVIKENLRANVNLRIALRMADEHDSQDVLGDEMAAHFPASIPGRAAAKTGPGRITPFQSAFPGARTTPEPEVQPIDVIDLDFGRARNWKLPERPRSDARVPKDVERVVGSIAAAARAGQVPAPRRPWLDSLASTYNLAKFSMRRDTKLPLGILDDPKRQDQLHEFFEPDEEGNILYVGTGGSGKSTALRSLGVASAITPGGGVAHVYGLDFGGGQLTYLEALPNVGSIVMGDDDERVRRLLDHLTRISDERKERYSALGTSNLAEYRRLADAPDEPRYLLLLDGFSSFRDEYETAVGRGSGYQQFQRLLLEGRAVGIHIAMSADRPNSVPNSVLSSFRRRVVLRLADADAYMSMGVPKDVLNSASPPGRAVQVGKPQELQLAVFLTDEAAADHNTSSAAQLAAMQALSNVIGRHHRPPPTIASLSSLISSSTLPDLVDGKPVLGMADADLAPLGFDPVGMIMVAGPAQSGRTNALLWLATAVRRRHTETAFVHLSARRSPLTGLAVWSLSADTESDIVEILDRLEPIAERQAPRDQPLVGLFVEYLPEFIGTTLEQRLTKLLGLCRRNGHLVVADGETPSWSSTWQLVLEMRNARTGLILQPDQQDGENLLRTSLPRVRRADFPIGRGFWVKSGKAEKVQIPLIDNWVEGPMDDLADSAQDLNHDAEPAPTAATLDLSDNDSSRLLQGA